MTVSGNYLRLLTSCVFAVVFTLMLASPGLAQITISRISDPTFAGDAIGSNAPSPVLGSAYVAYRITNGGSAIPDAWVTIGNFSDTVIGAGSNEDGLFHLGPLAAGATKYAYFYLTGHFTGAAASGTVSTTHSVAVYQGRPPAGTSLQTSSFSLTVGPGDIVQANSNKVNSGSVPAGLTLGSTFTMSVTGETGTIDTPRSWAFTPATDPAWPAYAFELQDVSITLSGGNSGTYSHQLFLSSELTSSANTTYTVNYTFRVTGVTAASTPVRFISYITSGGQYKHTSINSLSNIPALPPVTSGLTVSKSATPSSIGVLGGSTGTASYSVRLTNASSGVSTIDDFLDTLPAAPATASYVANTSKFGACGSETSIGEPQISGQELMWSGLFAVPASSNRCLTYSVTFPSTAGTYVNSALGRISSTGIYIGTSGSTSATANVAVTTPDLTISTDSPAFTQGQEGAIYTLAVSNSGTFATSGQVSVVDILPSSLMPTAASGSGWTCSIAGQTVTCARNDSLAANAGYPAITLTVNVAASASSPLSNTALVSGGGDAVGSNNSGAKSTIVNSSGSPNLTMTKTASAATVARGSSINFTLSVTNGGTVSTNSTIVTVTDILPAGLSANTANGTGWSCTISSQTVSCTRTDALSVAASYPGITVNAAVDLSADPSLTNTASVSGGGDSTAGSGSVSITTASPADLTIAKTAGTATVIRGASGTFTLTVTNDGGVATDGSTITVSDTMPAGLTPTAATGTGWACSIAAQNVFCARTDVLAAASSYPAVTIAASVALNAAASITNTASVSGGGDNSAANGSVTISTASATDLTLTKTSSSSTLIRGGSGSFTLTATNNGGIATDGTTVTLTDTLPAALTPTVATGTGWACSIAAQNVSCARSDVLAAASSYPAVTIAASVALNAAASLTNTASISGGGDNSAANGSVTISTASATDLTLTKTSSSSTLIRGGSGSFTLTATNNGGIATDGTTVTLTDTLPAALTPTVATGTGWACSIAAQNVSCERSDVLAAASSYPAVTIAASVALNAAASLTNTASISGGGDDSAANGSVTISTANATDLTVTKTSSSSTLIRGGSGSFTLTATNNGGIATDGTTVTLTDTLPTGLTPTAATGTGWACSIAAQNVSCARSDVLNATSSYPAVTIAASVALNAAASLTNTASISGGSDDSAANGSVTISTASATDLTVTKTSNSSTLIRGGSGSFTLTATNNGGIATDGTTVTLTDTLPTGLTPTAATGTGWACSIAGQNVSCARTDVLAAASSYPAVTIAASVALNAAASLTNTASISGGGDDSAANGSVTFSTAATTDLTITKTSSTSTVVRDTSGAFTLTVTNNGGVATDGTTVTVSDAMPAGLTPTAATGTGWACAIAGQNVSCTRSDVLNAASNYPAVTIAASVASNAAASLTNTAFVSGGGDNTAATGSVTINTAAGPDLALLKTVSTAVVLRGGSAAFQLKVLNNGGAATNNSLVTVTDTLPTGLIPASASGSGWTCSILAQNVTCVRSDMLNAGPAYPDIALGAFVTTDSPSTITNIASVSGGGDITPASGSATIQVPALPDLFITMNGGGPFQSGQSGVGYTVTIRNVGGSPTSGPVTFVNALPAVLSAASLSGPGWSCSAATLTCTRTDALASGASYPPITLLVNVSATTAATIVNTGTVSGGGETNTTNDVASLSSTIAEPADLSVTMNGPATLEQGQHGAVYTIDVSNVGAGVLTTPTVVTLNLPAGFTPASVEGSGWTCSAAGQTITCNRSGSLAPGASFPTITVRFDVDENATASAATSVSVNNNGDPVQSNNAASRPLTIVARPVDLVLSKTHNGDFTQGKPGVYTLTVRNAGTGATSGTVTVSDPLPSALSLVSAAGDGWNCGLSNQNLTCTRNDSLTGGSSYPSIALSVNVSGNAPASIVNTADVAVAGDVRPENNHVSDGATVLQITPDLEVTATHSGKFVRGQNTATFTILASNIGVGPATGEIRLTDVIPPGLTPAFAAGEGWTCTVAGQSVTCTRSDSLAAKANYPAVTIAMSVAPDASNAVTNTVSVNADRDSDTANNTATDEVAIISVTSVEILVTKDVDRPVVGPGETVGFRVGIANPSDAALTEVSLQDTLPPGFTYVSGSARIQTSGSFGQVGGEAQLIEPVGGANGLLLFQVGAMPARSRSTVSYATTVGANARTGEFQSKVVATATSVLGQKVSTAPVEVKVVVMRNAFSLTQVLVGRVFEDVNENGRFDNGEPGAPNIRVVTSTGQTATTDSYGQYNLPALSAGSVLIAVDSATLPDGLQLPAGEAQSGGASRLLRTPLEGGGMLRQNFGLIRTGPSPGASPQPTTIVHSEKNTGGEAVTIEIAPERLAMSAGGRDKQVIRILVRDKAGNAASSTSLTFSTAMGALLPISKTEGGITCESTLSLAERPDSQRQLALETTGGEAFMCLVSDIVPGVTHFTVTGSLNQELTVSSDLRFIPEARPPILVAIGEIGIGLSDPAKDATRDARRVDGQASVFYQDSITDKDLLTVAVRTKEGINNATGTPGMFSFDPTQRTYAVMGDASTRQELAQSTTRLYARYDRGRSYLLYGDLRGDSAKDHHNGLLEFNRNVTGIRAQLQGFEMSNWLQLQFARPKTAYTREIFTALSGSVVRLSKAQIVRGSETITLEVRDRRNPERSVSRETLVRNVDYALDNLSGVLYLTRPISLFDRTLNIVQIAATYEYEALGLDSAVYLGRGSYSVNGLGLRLGASFLNQNESGVKFAVGGIEAEQKLFRGGTVKAVVPISNGHLPTDVDYSFGVAAGQCCELGRNRNGKAIRVEFEQPLGFRRFVLRARFAKTETRFFNPYGSIEVPGQETSAASIETHPFESTKLSFAMENERNRNTAVDNHRRTFSARLSQTLRSNLIADAGIDRREFQDHQNLREIDSHLLSAGLQWKPADRLETSIRREENIGVADPTYPNQTLLGIQYRLTAASRIFATQRFSSAPILPISGAETGGLFSPTSKRETAFGIESRVYQNTNLTGRYRLDSGINGTDSFAVLGVVSRVPVRPGLAVDWSLEDALHIAGSGKGYIGGSIGLSQNRENKFRSAIRYELRRRERSQQLFMAGVVGRLTNATAALARYRVSDLWTGTTERISDGELALSVRPRQSDRVAFLLSYDYGRTRSGDMVSGSTASRRTDRLSADGLLDLTHGLEFYSRVAAARIPDPLGNRINATFLQSRLQQSLLRRFDIAVESRWIWQGDDSTTKILAAEWGTWLTRELRIGLGYSSRGFENPGSLMNATAARGGAYLVISSRLSGLFNLMGASH